MTTTHAVLVSGGKDSTALALRLVELDPETDYRFVCTPTGNELPDVLTHWDRLRTLLGKPIERIEHPDGLRGLIEAMKMLPSHHARWCTRLLKIDTAIAWYAKNAPCIAYVGLRADEMQRGGPLGSKVPQRYPMREWGWTITDVKAYLDKRGVAVPARTDCAWCYDQSLPEWWELWRNYPAIWAQGEDLEARIGHTFRSPERDSWPASMAGLRQRFDNGEVPRSAKINLSLFEAEPARCRACLL